MENINKVIYAKKALEQVPRLLSHLDRNPYSRTFGCFDWNYWTEKWKGCSVGRPQEYCLVLALLYMYRFPRGEEYYQNRKIFEWCLAAMLYWCEKQHSDGSVDENYFNEHQLGATTFTLYAVAKSVHLLKAEIDNEKKAYLERHIERSANFLKDYDETYLLSNHQSFVMIALHYAGAVLGKSFEDDIKKRLKRIIEGKSEDGWLREYSGADPGYLTITIANLAEYYEDTEDKAVLLLLKDAIKFISYFMVPGGNFGGIIGTRNTIHIWPSGFETLNAEFPLAGSISDYILSHIQTNALITPAKQDTYFGLQIYDYLWSYLKYSPRKKCPKLPVEGKNFRQIFKGSNTLIQKRKNTYTIINAGKGGVLRVWDYGSGSMIKADAGLIGQLTTGDVVTTCWPDSRFNISFDEDSATVSVKGQFHDASLQYPTVLKWAVFNIGNFFLGRNVKITNFIKDVLIRKLITKEKRYPIDFERKIDFNTHMITDKIGFNGNLEFKSLAAYDEIKMIVMGYSKYFYESELKTNSYVFSKEEIDTLNKKKKLMVSH